jgi:hypothetical protein
MSLIGNETDMPRYLGDVRYWVNSGKHLLSLSFSGFDPSRKSSTPFAVTYEAATLPSGRAKLLSSG